MKRKYVLKNKRRFCSIIIVLTILLTTVLFATTSYGSAETQYDIVTVEKGDTLWEIAGRYNKDGDVRKLIYEIKEANDLKDSVIYEGDSLKIPM